MGTSDANTLRSHVLAATKSGKQEVTLNWEVISTTGDTGYKINREWKGLVTVKRTGSSRNSRDGGGLGSNGRL